MIGRSVLMVCFAIIFVACGNQNKSPEEMQKDWELLDQSEYSIKYPHTWAVNQTGYEGTTFLLISKQTSIRDFYQENVGLVIEDIPETISTVEEFAKNAVTELNASVADIVVSESSLQKNGAGKSFYRVVYTGREKSHKVTVEKHYYLANEKAYVLSFSGKTLELGRYQPVAQGILHSFRIK